MNHESECRDEGYQAWHNGYLLEHNPYPADSVEAEWWCLGWQEAEAESEAEDE